MSTILITGGNRGIGRETARQLVAAGHDVLIGVRDPERGQAAAQAVGCRWIQLDVTDACQVKAAAAGLSHLDVLVNNAGICGDMRSTFETNVFAVAHVMDAFLPLLGLSEAPSIVNVSSGVGSLSHTTNPARIEYGVFLPPYAASKAALNMLTTQYAAAYPDIRINVVDPGFTATDINDHRGTQTVEEGAEVVVRMAQIGPDGPTGGFFDRFGSVPW
ncbi:SDR family NAD(P)-dependent oxidoreductase [Lentzea sp. NPDC054927]